MLNNIKKIIVTDLDGTLLNNRRRVSYKSTKILRKLNKNGYMIVLASGRPWRSMKSVYRKIRCFGPVISYNGAYVFHPKDPTFAPLLEKFPQSIIKEIYSKCLGHTESFMCESLDTVYVNQKDKYLKHFYWYKGMKIVQGNLLEKMNEDPMTGIILRPSADDKIIDEACSNLGKVHLRHWTSSNYAELYMDGVDKGTALNFVQKSLCIDKQNIIGFGDADNDYCFLKECGLPFAMKNTKSKTLISNFVLTQFDNSHDGVALTLLKILK